MTSTTFSTGTVVASSWLNDVDQAVYDDVRGLRANYYSTIVGNGTDDDSAGLTSLFNLAVATGGICQLDENKTYGIADMSFTFPAGLKLKTNGATFKILTTTTGNEVFMTVGNDTFIDALNIQIPSGIQRDRTLLVSGTGIQIGTISVTSTDLQTTTEASDYGVSITSCTRARIGSIYTANIDRAVTVSLNTDTDIGGIFVSSYVRGIYIHGNTRLKIGKSAVYTRSSNASQTAGHNGVLLGRDGTDQVDVTLEDFTVNDAGEHGIRIGGGPQKRVFLVRPRIFNAQGNGIKILGTDNTAPVAGEYQDTLVIDSPVIEDVGTGTGSGTNLCGILIERSNNVIVKNPSIRPRSATYAAIYGIRVFSCTDVTLSDVDIKKVQIEGIRVDTEDSGAVSTGSSRIRINGGLIYECADDGITLSASDSQTLADIVITGLRSQANTNRGIAIATGTGGAFTNCVVNASTASNTGGAIVCNSSNVTLQMKSTATEITTTPLSGVTAANGSWYDDGTTLNYRKAGAWTAL